MKKILSLVLVLALALSLTVPAFATVSKTNTDEGLATSVVYNTQNTGETWTVTVPADLAPGGAAETVTATGTFPSNKTLTVTADDEVVLTDSTIANASYTLAVEFNGISLPGSNTGMVSDTETVSVAAFAQDNTPVLGDWNGSFNYTVSLDTVTPQVQTFSIMRSTNAGNNAYSWADFAAKVNDGTAVDANVTVAEVVDGQIEVSVGTSTYWYSGEFNANGNMDNCSFSGYVFDYVDGATIKNLELKDTSLAGLIKNAKGTVTISNCTFTNCTVNDIEGMGHNSVYQYIVRNVQSGTVVFDNVVFTGLTNSSWDGTYNGTWNGTTFTPAS